MLKSTREDQPNFYIRSKIAHEPVITFSNEELNTKSLDELTKIQNYHLLTLKLLVGDQVFNILHNISCIDELTKKKSHVK